MAQPPKMNSRLKGTTRNWGARWKAAGAWKGGFKIYETPFLSIYP